MNYSLQVHGAKYVFPIPDGLKELSSDIIREVLRHQPDHITGFIADYLETMLQVREHARDAGVVIGNVLQEGFFYEELKRNKDIDRKQANYYVTLIQAAWRGYITRRRIEEWYTRKKRIESEKERKKALKVEEFLAGLGITYEEARRAAGAIQDAYKETKRGKWISGEMGEFWVAETVPFGERLREGDRVQGRYDRWEKEDFGDFFEMDEAGAIQHDWPRVGMLRKVLRDEIPSNVPIVEFFAMRDMEGKEQYAYLIKSPAETEVKGHPIGFIVPKLKFTQEENEYPEIDFTDPQNDLRMGRYIYVFRDDLTRDDLKSFLEILKTKELEKLDLESMGEHENETQWVVPRVLIRIKKDLLQKGHYEMKFVTLPPTITCEQEDYTFRAETIEQTIKIIKHILRNKCVSVEEGLSEAANMKPYKLHETGRIFAVEKFIEPSYIQKIHISPESATAEEESLDIMLYNYVFVTSDYRGNKVFPKGEPLYSIPIIRFQGYHSDYKGSESPDMETKVFILGPKIPTPDGRPFNHESLFWDEYGLEAWYQLLYNRETQQETELTEQEEGKPPSSETPKIEISGKESSKLKTQSESLSVPSSVAQDSVIPPSETPRPSQQTADEVSQAKKPSLGEEDEGEVKHLTVEEEQAVDAEIELIRSAAEMAEKRNTSIDVESREEKPSEQQPPPSRQPSRMESRRQTFSSVVSKDVASRPSKDVMSARPSKDVPRPSKDVPRPSKDVPRPSKDVSRPSREVSHASHFSQAPPEPPKE